MSKALVSGAVAAFLLVSVAAVPEVLAADPPDVLIGMIYPMSGPAGPVGVDARHAAETALDIINNDYDLDLPLAKGKGLTNLGGAQMKISFADHQADPQKGRAEAERLVTQDKVVGIVGAYHSAVAAVIAQVTDRYQIPFVAADSTSPSLTRRGFKYFFRPTAHDEMFSIAMFDFFKDLKEKKNINVQTVSLFAEDTLFGKDSSDAQRKLAGERGIKVLADIKYRANNPSLTAEVQSLKSANAEVLMPTSYIADAILLIKTMGELGYKPMGILAQDAGFTEPTTYAAIAERGNGIMTRGSFSLDVKRPAIAKVNEMFKARSGKDLSDTTARELMGVLVMAEAINRAGSAEPAKITEALQKTDIPGSQTIMPWAKIKFDETGQNLDATPIMLQYGDGGFHTVWPFEVAGREVVWPMSK